jgi:hypothetical protein
MMAYKIKNAFETNAFIHFHFTAFLHLWGLLLIVWYASIMEKEEFFFTLCGVLHFYT